MRTLVMTQQSNNAIALCSVVILTTRIVAAGGR